MANWSNTAIILTGDAWHIRRALDALESRKFDLFLANIHWTHNADNLTLSIFGEGRWSTDPTEAIDFAAQHNLSGTFKDSEPGNDFFRLIEFDADGEITNDIHTDYYSMEHFEWEPDKQWWIEQLYWIFDDPSPETIYAEHYQFLLDIGFTMEELTDESIRIIDPINNSQHA